MAGMLEDLENQIDREKKRAQLKKAEDAQKKAEEAAKKIQKDKDQSIFF